MLISELYGEKILLQDTTILQKDTVLVINNQVSLIQINDSSGISEISDSVPGGNISDIILSPNTVTEGRTARDTFPVRSSITPYQEPQLKSAYNLYKDEEIPYLLINENDLIRDYIPLKRFGDQYYFARDSSLLVYKQQQKNVVITSSNQNNLSFTEEKTPIFDMSPDWLMGIIIVSLIVLAWLKLFYHKFINHTVTALWNFQLSKKEFRDQNIFARRVASILNLNFIIIGGLFIYLILNHFHINPFHLKPFPLYLSLTGLLATILLIRYILLSLTGYIFNRQEHFKEYLYQILLINKNIGIYFIPLIVGIAYLQDNLRIYLIIIGLALFVLAYLFRFVKGIQIIIKKDVLIFYLILYLCTLEILPVVIYCKFFSSWL